MMSDVVRRFLNGKSKLIPPVSYPCYCIASWIHSYFDNVVTKFMINNWTDAWKTDVNLLIVFLQAAKKAKSKQSPAQKSPQKRSRKSKGGADADESQGSLFDIVKAGKGALRVFHCNWC